MFVHFMALFCLLKIWLFSRMSGYTLRQSSLTVQQIGPSHEAAINGSKRGQGGITSEAKFLCWKFHIVKPINYFKHTT